MDVWLPWRCARVWSRLLLSLSARAVPGQGETSINGSVGVFPLCAADERTPGGPVLHHLHRLCSVHLLPDDHLGHIRCALVSNLNFVPAQPPSHREARAHSRPLGRIPSGAQDKTKPIRSTTVLN